MAAGSVSVAAGLALAWGAVDPLVVRAVPTGGLVLLVAMVALPVLLTGVAGASRVMAGAAEEESSHEIDGTRAGGAAGVGTVRHVSHGGDRHERPHAPRSPRSRAAHRAIESSDGSSEE